MSDNTPDVRVVNCGGSWWCHTVHNLRIATTDDDHSHQTYGTLGFRTFRHYRQSLDQQQPRS